MKFKPTNINMSKAFHIEIEEDIWNDFLKTPYSNWTYCFVNNKTQIQYNETKERKCQ